MPYQLVHESVEARYTATVVEVVFKGKRVASHPRIRGRGQFSTLPQHMPAAHRAQAQWSPSRLIGWAAKTGPGTRHVAAELLRTLPHPEQGYRSCLGLMRLAKRYGPERLEAACHRAEHIGSCRYRTVKNILVAGMDRLPLQDQEPTVGSLPVHDNIRGADYYAKDPTPC